MSTKESKIILFSQDSFLMRQTQRLNNDKIQIYSIKVDQIQRNVCKKYTERNIYLNITFCDCKKNTFQTQCVDIISNNKFFEIRTTNDIEKVEVLDYDSFKKICKISLKGVSKEFQHTHVESKSEIQVHIQRAISSLIISSKNCKLTESAMIEHRVEQKDVEKTNDSTSAFSS